jgi:hypothetical protein
MGRLFKADGHTLVVDAASLRLRGTPTVVPTPGSQGNLRNTNVDAGDSVGIPSVLGLFKTVMKPIQLTSPIGPVKAMGGLIGCVAVLLEENNTPNSDIEKGHAALNGTLRDKLAEILPTLTLNHPVPTEAEIAAVTSQIISAVEKAIKDSVSVWDWLGGIGDMDDLIGSTVWRFTHDELEKSGGVPIRYSARWKKEGDWELNGYIKATVI